MVFSYLFCGVVCVCNIWRSTKYNVQYINNIVAGKEWKWKENRLISLNAKILFTGGKRLVPIDLQASIAQDETVYRNDLLWTTQATPYFRVDLGAKLHFLKPKVEHIVSLDIQNATNRLNQWTQFYNATTQAIEVYPMAGLIPIISYKIKF